MALLITYSYLSKTLPLCWLREPSYTYISSRAQTLEAPYSANSTSSTSYPSPSPVTTFCLLLCDSDFTQVLTIGRVTTLHHSSTQKPQNWCTPGNPSVAPSQNTSTPPSIPILLTLATNKCVGTLREDRYSPTLGGGATSQNDTSSLIETIK